MDAFEPKKLALIRILQILKEHSDRSHPLKQEEIAAYLENSYGISIERKAIGRNISLLKEAGYSIESGRNGSYLDEREFEDSELRMLIDGVICSKYINAKHSKDLVEKLCRMSSKHFRSHVKHIFSLNEWSKSDNRALFYNIELIDDAIERGRQIAFDYNKYGIDKKLHVTKHHTVSPYQLVLHNRQYYLMGRSERWHNMGNYRVDHITNMEILDEPLNPVTTIEGYENGIDFKQISSAMPYMYTDRPERVEFVADAFVLDQIVDWFGSEVRLSKIDDSKVKAEITVSLKAMEHWAMQYINFVEVTSPLSLREKIKENLTKAQEKYNKE